MVGLRGERGIKPLPVANVGGRARDAERTSASGERDGEPDEACSQGAMDIDKVTSDLGARLNTAIAAVTEAGSTRSTGGRTRWSRTRGDYSYLSANPTHPPARRPPTTTTSPQPNTANVEGFTYDESLLGSRALCKGGTTIFWPSPPGPAPRHMATLTFSDSRCEQSRACEQTKVMIVLRRTVRTHTKRSPHPCRSPVPRAGRCRSRSRAGRPRPRLLNTRAPVTQ